MGEALLMLPSGSIPSRAFRGSYVLALKNSHTARWLLPPELERVSCDMRLKSPGQRPMAVTSNGWSSVRQQVVPRKMDVGLA